jgi:hypothetical protein
MSSWVMPIQDFVELLTIEVRNLPEKQKIGFRCGVRQAFKITTPKIGDAVTVELLNGRKIRGVVKAVYDSVSGKKFQISSGEITVKVEEGQILK